MKLNNRYLLLLSLVSLFFLYQSSFFLVKAVIVVSGKVVTTAGVGIPNVVVSDGYETTKTDAAGTYTLQGNDLAKFVFVSIPADCEAPISNGVPVFYQNIKGMKNVVANFTLLKKAKEPGFVLAVMADQQMQKDEDMLRYTTETKLDYENFRTSYPETMPIVGLTAGDNTWDNPGLYVPYVKDLADCPFPWFHVIGNHDHDENVLDNDYEASHNYEKYFGPTYYSFNKSDCHFVALDNIIYNARKDYQEKISTEQLNWLKKDLAYVAKDQLIILGMHCPAMRRGGKTGITNLSSLLSVLSGYKVLIVSGHTHRMNRTILSANVEEYTMSPTMGNTWVGDIGVDGCPNGYGVFEIEGNKLVGQYYKATGKDKSYQMNVYPIGKVDAQVKSVVAHVWNFSVGWKVEVFEDGVNKGKMAQFTGTDPLAYDFFIGEDKPIRKPSLEPATSPSLFYYTPKKSTATIRVVATDPFGVVYSETLNKASEENKAIELPKQRQVFFTESMGEGASPSQDILSWKSWQNPNITISSGGASSRPDVRNTASSIAEVPPYKECSGENNVYFKAGTGADMGFAIHQIDASNFSEIELSFGYYKSVDGVRSVVELAYWDGTKWVDLPCAFKEEAELRAWFRSPVIRLPENAQRADLALRFIKASDNSIGIRIDDIWLTGIPKFSEPPQIKPIRDRQATSFTAEWEPVPGASSYLLEVSENENFSLSTTETVLAGWNFTETSTINSAVKPTVYVAANKNKTLSCNATGSSSSPIPYLGGSGKVGNPYAAVCLGWDDGVYKKHFQIDIDASGYYDLSISSMLRTSSSGPKYTATQYRLSPESEWIDVPTDHLIHPEGTYSFTTQQIEVPLPSACNNQKNVSIRWTPAYFLRASGASPYNIGSSGSSRIANIYVKGKTGSFVSGYESKKIATSSYTVSGLTAGKEYFYRVRASDDKRVSNVSEVASSLVYSSISDTHAKSNPVAYYQPSTQCFVVEGLASASVSSLWLRDINGRLLASKTTNLEVDQFFTPECLPGVYLVTVRTENALYSFKCVKAK